MSAHGKELAVLDRAGHEGRAPITRILYQPTADNTNNFFFLTERISSPDEAIPGVNLVTICLHCLIDAHPEVGRGMELARETGWAEHNGEDWATV